MATADIAAWRIMNHRDAEIAEKDGHAKTRRREGSEVATLSFAVFAPSREK